MVAATFSSCGTTIQNFQQCDLIPGGLGAVCDDFLDSNPTTLSQSQWNDTMALWNSQGDAVACMRSSSEASLKSEIEKLCTDAPWYAPCDEQTKIILINGLSRLFNLQAKVLK
jgi:hypothetical protein